MVKTEQWTRQLIAGEWREGSSPNHYTDTNPFNNEPIVEIRLVTKEDVDAVYKAAQRAQAGWQAVNPYEQSAIMERAAEVFSRHREEIVGHSTSSPR